MSIDFNLMHILQVELFTQSNCKSKSNPYIDQCSGMMDDKYFGGHPVPKTYIPYETVIKDKFRYQTITFMKVRITICFGYLKP